MENRCGQAASLFLDALSKNREKGKNESLLKAFLPFRPPQTGRPIRGFRKKSVTRS